MAFEFDNDLNIGRFLDTFSYGKKPYRNDLKNIFADPQNYKLSELNQLLGAAPKRPKKEYLPGFGPTGEDLANLTNDFNSLYTAIGNTFVDLKGGTGDEAKSSKDKKKDSTGKVEGTGTLYTPSEATQEVAGIDPIAPIPGKSVRDQVGPDYQPRSSGRGVAGIEGIASRYGLGRHLGAVAMTEALKAGYRPEDIRNAYYGGYLPRATDGTPLRIGGIARRVIDNPGQIHEFYGYGTGADHINRRNFGGEDYNVNKAIGWSDLAIKEYLDRNTGKLASHNRPGVAGGLYEMIKSKLPKPIAGVAGVAGKAAKSLLIGGSQLGQSGYASGVTSNRSSAYTSGKNTMGTSQYRR